MNRSRPVLVGVVNATLLVLLLTRSALADPAAESAAKDALEKVAAQYSAGDYAGAMARLKKAVTTCAPGRCAPATRALLLRDLGVMQFRAGDKEDAQKSFDDALALDATLMLDPYYDASDVGAAFEDERAAAGLNAAPVSSKPPPGAAVPAPLLPPAPAAPIDQPTGGDFVHTPVREQRENTPLPIHVEYSGKSPLAQVIVKYKGAQMRDWSRVELKRVEGKGWEGLIPCEDVTRGVMRYWVQGFDKTKDPVAASGDPKRTFGVVIRDKISGEAPHLPGKPPPRVCQDSDCPPGIAGCHTGETAGSGEAAGSGRAASSPKESEGAPDETAPSAEPSDGSFSRLWIGVSGAVDFLVLPAANDVCSVKPSLAPLNSAGYYCYGYDPALGFNANFPSNPSENALINKGRGGSVPGGFTLGNVRVMAALDYALTSNFLAGLRVGYAFNSYQGRGAAFDSKLHLEARGTFLIGRSPLAHPGLSPMGFVGAGVSQFDGRTTTHDLLVTTFRDPQTEDAWLSDGPFFVAVGAGVRYAASRRFAFTGALRVNLVFGGVGFLPTFGPEIGAAYGF
jgi:hypothetical protein